MGIGLSVQSLGTGEIPCSLLLTREKRRTGCYIMGQNTLPTGKPSNNEPDYTEGLAIVKPRNRLQLVICIDRTLAIVKS